MIEPLERDETTLPPLPGHWPFHSPAPTVTFLREESTQHPFALAVAAAWTCYGATPGQGRERAQARL